MSAQAVTVVSGIVLLIVFVLAGWVVKRRRDRPRNDDVAQEYDQRTEK